MAKQRGMPLPPDIGNASDRRDPAAQEEKVWVLESDWSGSTRVWSFASQLVQCQRKKE